MYGTWQSRPTSNITIILPLHNVRYAVTVGNILLKNDYVSYALKGTKL